MFFALFAPRRRSQRKSTILVQSFGTTFHFSHFSQVRDCNYTRLGDEWKRWNVGFLWFGLIFSRSLLTNSRRSANLFNPSTPFSTNSNHFSVISPHYHRRNIKCKWVDVKMRDSKGFQMVKLDSMKDERVSANETRGHFSTFSCSSSLSQREWILFCVKIYIVNDLTQPSNDPNWLSRCFMNFRFDEMFDVSFSLLMLHDKSNQIFRNVTKNVFNFRIEDR